MRGLDGVARQTRHIGQLQQLCLRPDPNGAFLEYMRVVI